ncbi:MAG TPA: phytanoyl-CoA dioxygenase family protein [Rhizomicrobium sp.]|nr:phytanoyl-CoA dioxygenase family protein [Rhizomicrobium sp.]
MSSSVYKTINNIGDEITVPWTVADDVAYFSRPDTDECRAYYDENGYVVIRGLVPRELCDAANDAFDAECLSSDRYIYRQTTARPERNRFSDHGLILNPILNVQSVDPRFFGRFRAEAEAVFTAPGMQAACKALFGEPGKLVQSMYFHGNPSTPPHQDTYYLDSERAGAMSAAWIATEDIAPGAGRFFICPRSHRIDTEKGAPDFDAEGDDRYLDYVVDVIRNHQLRFSAPALAKGDVLFWNSRTIHGSLPTTQPEISRRSFTAHWIPESTRFMQFRSRIKPMTYDRVRGVQISRPKDQAALVNRMMLFGEVSFPRTFAAAKTIAMKALVR